MIEKIKEAVASHEGEPGIVGYALLIFADDGSCTLDAEVTQSALNTEAEEEALLAIAEVANALGFDPQEAELH